MGGNGPQFKAFERAAAVRERTWILKLCSLFPQGFNQRLPLKRFKTRRQRRISIWRPKQSMNTPINICNKCVILQENDTISIHQHDGPDAHLRRTLQKWIVMANVCSKAVLKKEIERASVHHHFSILRWMYENISNREK